MEQTTRFERLSYGGFFFGQNILYILQFQFLTYFYTEEVGISLGSTATLLLVARLWDACNDPIMGAIVDKCQFKSGKYLPWIRVITYVLPLSIVFVFINVGGSMGAKLVYAYISYIAFGMIYTVSDMPLFSLSTVMTSSLYERDKLLSMGRFGAALAAISTAVFMSLKGALGWTWAIAVYAGVCLLVMLPLQFTARERVERAREGITVKRIFSYLAHNRYLLIYYAGYLIISATNTLQTMVVYFADSNLKDEGMTTVLLGVCIAPILALAPMLPKLIERFGKRRLTVVSCAVSAGICAAQYFMGYDSLPLFLAVSAVRVVFMQIPMLIYGMFTADCIEYGAHRTGIRAEGISFAIQTFVTKLAAAICSALCLGVMGMFGYAAGAAEQTPLALHGIWVTMTLIPIAGFVGMMAAMWFYRLKESDVERMMKVEGERS